MHLYFITRGIKKDVDELVKFLETRTLYMPYTDKDGKKMKMPVQAALRPIQLWEYVFPAEEKDKVFTTLNADYNPVPNNLKMRTGVAALRKLLGAKKVKKGSFKKDQQLFIPNNLWYSLIPIGYKEDELNFKDPNTGATHEAL